MSNLASKNSSEEFPILDAQKLQSIKDLADGDDNFFKELTDLFFQRAPVLMGEITKAFEAKDHYTLERSSHALKGSAGNLGAMKMMKICEDLEHKGRAEDLSNVDGLIKELQEVYPITEKEMKDDWL